MKKDDIVAREVNLPEGTAVLLNVSSPEVAKAFMETDFLQEYGCVPTYKIETNLETGQGEVILTQAVTKQEEAKVNWVVENEVALEFKGGGCRIITLEEEPECKVIQESVPRYQSSVAGLTDEQLRSAIDDLRNQRTFITSKPRKTREKGEVIDKNDPLVVALAGMDEGKKLELMRKMGMID